MQKENCSLEGDGHLSCDRADSNVAYDWSATHKEIHTRIPPKHSSLQLVLYVAGTSPSIDC